MHKNYEPSGLDNIVVRPVYLRAVNAIVQPEIQVPCSLYFLQRWLPRLGTLRWCLVLALRTICTQRQPDGTNRGEITRTELAKALGVHEATISRVLNTAPSSIHHGWRVLQPLTNDDQETAWLAKFIPRLRYKYERDALAGVTRRVGYIIDVIMDDPLIPEDEEKLAVVLAEQVLQALPSSPGVKMHDVAQRPYEAQVALDVPAATTGIPSTPRARSGVARPVKSQNTSSTDHITEQNAPYTGQRNAQHTPSHSGVNQHNAPYVLASAQDPPTLTLTNNFKYRDITVDLTLTRKRDIRLALTPLVELAATSLNDHHSKGMFFATLTQLYPEHLDVFTGALEVAEREGRLGRDVNMGVVFVHAVKGLAAASGVALRLGKKREVETVEDRDVASVEEGAVQGERGRGNEAVYVPGAGVSVKQLWPAVLQELRGRTSRGNYEMWLRSCEIVGFDGNVVILGAPSAFARDWISDRLLGVIENALRNVVGKEVTVRCEVQRTRGSRI